jgi:twitching motility two-component system response regulator PilG
LQGLKILVIDDSKTIRRTAETLLAKEGCEVFTAVEVSTRWVEDRLTHLVDIMCRLDGHQTCSIKHNKVSGTHRSSCCRAKIGCRPARGRLVGSEQYLTKPFTKDELLGAIHSRDEVADRKDWYGLIMIVDDSPPRCVLKTALEKHGFDTVSAADGSECLSLAREVADLIHGRRYAARQRLQATRTLTRSATKSIPVVMITTKTRDRPDLGHAPGC